ncbi:MAG: tRNA epoxyqueuosine(34) reductase QueG [Armatimonadetes bacterium]|nr:tRNA epoxyqueuosine(34) reductase QueG [Armatimonadota bacterium]
MDTTLTQAIKARARELGFDQVGVAPARSGPHAAFLDAWLARGHAAGMSYLARDPEKRKDPRRVLPGARSVVVCALNYYPGGDPEGTGNPGRGTIARYARGRDYHDPLKARLWSLADFIRSRAPDPCEARAYVDTGPVLEREAAALAGIGQFGKNTVLINRELGSYFFIGIVITTLTLEADPPSTRDICGRCHRCLDACPTGALRNPYELDARRCISYLTIEHRGAIPPELREGIGRRIFGCDICQEVCPWNRKRPRPTTDTELEPRPENAAPALTELLRLDQEAFSRRFRGSPIQRAKRRGLLRSVAVALGNAADPATVPTLAAALSDPEPLVRAHAAWSLGRIATPEARAALRAALTREEEPSVIEEIRGALGSGGW